MLEFISIMQYNKFTEDQIKEAAKNSYSIAEMCRQLGLIPAGGNYASMKRRITRFDVDVSHFTGAGWNKDNYKDQPNSKTSLKKKLIRERGHQCEKCKNTTWLELPIMLELEHIDGNNGNNEITNLLLLCPNCHAQTKTWRRAKSSFEENPKLICPLCNGPKQSKSQRCGECYRNSKKGKKLFPQETIQRPKLSQKLCGCGAEITPQAKQCTQCAHVKQQRIDWPSVEELVARLRDNSESYSAVARSLGISDNSVRKYLRKNGIDPKTFKSLV